MCKNLNTIVAIDTEKGGYWFLDGGILSFKYHKRVSRLIWDAGGYFCRFEIQSFKKAASTDTLFNL